MSILPNKPSKTPLGAFASEYKISLQNDCVTNKTSTKRTKKKTRNKYLKKKTRNKISNNKSNKLRIGPSLTPVQTEVIKRTPLKSKLNILPIHPSTGKPFEV